MRGRREGVVDGSANGTRARRLSVGLVVVLVFALVLAACGKAKVSSTAKTKTAVATTSNVYLDWAPCCSWGTTWSLNYYNPLALGIADGLVVLPLAVEQYPSLRKFTPQVASSWSVSGNTLRINVRRGMKWQNGMPVTAKDVYDTIVLDGTEGGAGWLYIKSVGMPSAHEVTVTAEPGTNMVLLEDNVLPRTIWPSSVYGKFVTPKLVADEEAYYAEDYVNPAAAAKMSQYADMLSVFKKLSSMTVAKEIGDGPFELKAINTAEAILVKSPSFYDASDVHIAGIKYIDDPNDEIYPLLYSGSADFSNVYMSPAILKKWLATPGAHVVDLPAFTYNLMFNDSKYPLNMTSVRQALAYVIPRAGMIDAAYGSGGLKGDGGGVVNQHPDGLPTFLNAKYLTHSELSSLNTYPVNDAKATSLLEAAGFHKSGGSWIMPNGKPFTVTFLVNSSTTDIVSSFEDAAAALKAFGISASVDATEGTIQSEDLYKGDFDLNMAFFGGVDPLGYFSAALGRGENFENLGNYAGKRGIGFGPTVSVPGIGTVNVPHTVDVEDEKVGPGAEMDRLVYDWARLVNTDVPYLTYGTKGYQFPYSSAHFTDWPSSTDPLWNVMALGNMNEGLTLMLEHGFIRPKS
jgi:peptide/nickel transport system substrate-binding protein